MLPPNRELVVSGDARSAAASQNFEGFFRPPAFGSEQQKFPAVRESHRVRFDHLIGQAVIVQVGLKRPDDSLVIWFATGG